MDNPYQPLPPEYGQPGQTGVVLPGRNSNPYNMPQITPIAPVQPAAPQFPSMTDFIVKQAKAEGKDPSQLSDDDIKGYGKQYVAYDPKSLTDPTKTGPLARHLGEAYNGTRENFELHHAAHAGRATEELEQNLPAVKDYLKTLAGSGQQLHQQRMR
jgi:hypothetical protein